MQIVQLLSSGPHMAITAAAAWALYAATQENRPVALAAYANGALQPLLDLIQGGGSQVSSIRSSLDTATCPRQHGGSGSVGAGVGDG